MRPTSIGEELLEGRRRRTGEPPITPEGRAILRRLLTGDLIDEFQSALDAVTEGPVARRAGISTRTEFNSAQRLKH